MRHLVIVCLFAAAGCAGCLNVDVERGERHRDRHPPPEPPPPGPQAYWARDAYERDNDRDRPSAIQLGETQARTIYPKKDEDWIVCRTQRTGQYAVVFSNVTRKLSVEVWVPDREDRDDEDKVGKFKVSPPGESHVVGIGRRPRYIKLKVECDDGDDVAAYQVTILPR